MAKIPPVFKKTLEVFLLVAAIFVLITSCTVLGLFWKLSHGPVNVTWAQKYIQQALGGDKSGMSVKADGIIAEWKSFKDPLTLGISDLTIESQGNVILKVSQAGLRLAKAPLFFGIVLPEAIFIKNPAVNLEKTEDGNLKFLIASPQKELTPAPVSQSMKLTPQEIANSLFLGGILKDDSKLPLSKLESFIIENAVITIEDKTQNKTFTLSSANLSLSRETDSFNLTLDYKNPNTERSKINIVAVRKTLKQQIKFILNLTDVDAGLWALNFPSLPGLMKDNFTFGGQITGIFDLEWTLKGLNGSIKTMQGKSEQQNFKIAANRDPQTGIIPIELSLAQVTLDQIASVWPEQLSHLSITDWFTKKLSKGIIKNFDVTVPFKNENGRWMIAGLASGSMDFENLTCDYRPPLYPISAGYGHADIKNNVLTIKIQKAKFDNMDVKSGTVTIDKLVSDDPEPGHAKIDVNVEGPLKTGFRYVALEPINLGAKLKTDPDKVEGKAKVHAVVTFPTLKDLPADQVVAVVDADLTETKLPKIAHGMDITGGPFKLKVEKGQFSLSGKGELEGAPIDFTYSEFLNSETAPFASDIKAKLMTDDALRAKFGIDLSDYIAGKVGVDLTYRQDNDKTTNINIKADLTPGKTFVAPLNYLKKEGVPGEAIARMVLKGDAIDKVKELDVTIGKDEARGGALYFGMLGKEHTVTSVNFEHVRLGEANDFALKMQQTTTVTKISAIGKAIDARGILGKSPQAATPRHRDIDMTIATNVMRMGDAPDQFLKYPKLHAIVNPQGDVKFLDLKSTVGTNSVLSMNVSPSPQGVMNLRIDSNNAGAALKAVGVYENMVGGSLAVSGAQIANGGLNDIQGAALVSNFNIVKAPALAQLVGAFSVTGLPELLANDGISFSKLKTDFIWRKTQNGNRIINLYDGATSGGSVGLTFGGIINQTESTMDLSGTFVPISQINRIVSSIPLVGTLLTGGKNGGIIAATYAMKGPTKDPRVTVNPLSVLAPGFLRSLLFEGGMNSGRDEKPIVPRTQRAKN